jgi:hypothetical protein
MLYIHIQYVYTYGTIAFFLVNFVTYYALYYPGKVLTKSACIGISYKQIIVHYIIYGLLRVSMFTVLRLLLRTSNNQNYNMRA